MTISPIYPSILQNGTVADASQVMANFYTIQNDVNANAAHNGVNSDITSLIGLTTPLPISEGGTGAATASGARDNLGITAALAAIVSVPIGGSIIWNTTTAPTSFLEENGQAVSRATYAALFAVIGTTFGVGDGSTTFNLPDSRGMFVRGWSNGSTVDSGRAFGSNQTDQFQTHGHTVVDPTHMHLFDVSSGAGGTQQLNGTPGNAPGTINTHAASTGITVTTPNSGNTGSETRPINIAKMYCIRYQ